MLDVESVDQIGRVGPHCSQLSFERQLLGGVGQHEGVCGCSSGGNAITAACLEVRRGIKPANVGGPGGCNRCVGVGTTTAAIDQSPTIGGVGDSGGSTGNGTVVVEHRKQHSLEHDTFGKTALDRQHRAIRKEQFTIGVPGDITSKVIVRQPVSHWTRRHNTSSHQMFDDVAAKAEVADGFDQPVHTSDHAIGPASRQPAGEYFEHRIATGDARLERRCNHRQLVMVGM